MKSRIKMFGGQISNAILILLTASIVLIYFHAKRVYSYWQRRGVSQLKPVFPFGDGGKIFYQRLSLIEQMDEWYHSTTEPFVGVYTFFQPLLIVRDPDCIRSILIKDFAYFADRLIPVDEETDPLAAHLFNLKGDKWKNLRVKLTPTFTTSKMKAIFTMLLDLNGPLLRHIEQMASADQTVECYNLAVNHTTNGIISVGFGIDIDCFADPDTPFRRYGRRISEPNLKNTLRTICSILCPSLKRWLGIHNVDRDAEDFMYDMMGQLMELRDRNGIVRSDFFHLLVQLLNTGNVRLDDEWSTLIANECVKSYTIQEVTAQALIFFVAGSETSATTIAFCLYELAKNPGVQQRLQEEIDSAVKLTNGQFTFDSINAMNYLRCCIDGIPISNGRLNHNHLVSSCNKISLLLLFRDASKILCVRYAEPRMHQGLSNTWNSCNCGKRYFNNNSDILNATR